MTIPLDDLMLWLLVVTRLGALMSFIPAIGERNIPKRVRLALAGLASIIVVPLLPEETMVPVPGPAVFLLVARELIIGVLMGFAVRMTFYMLDIAGRIVAQEAGLARMDAFDPASQTQTTAVSALYFNLAAVILMALGVHHEVIAVFVRSYDLAPVGQFWPNAAGIEQFIRATAEIWIVAVKVAAPVIALNLVINLTFSVLGKAAPKVNVFITSFAVRILAGIWLMLATVGLVVGYLMRGIEASPERMFQFLGF
jgi:flagellar biosynthetic protein FliR